MTDSQYVVEVEVEGFEAVTGTENRVIDPADRDRLNRERLDYLPDDVNLVETLVRDDGTGILWFGWDPPAEDEVDLDLGEDEKATGGAKTWQTAKEYTEHIRSSVVGAQFQVVECRIGLREAS